MSFVVGTSVTIRDVRSGTVYFAWPQRVIGHRGHLVLLGQIPGALGRVPRGYPTDQGAVLHQLTSGEPELVELAWKDTVTLALCQEGATWVTRLFWDAGTGGFLCYYVDFVRPVVFQERTIDTSDLELDIVVDPQGTWRYKDVESYELLRQGGWVTEADHVTIESAKAQVIEAIESRRFPFDDSLVGWRWPEAVPAGTLASGWDA